MQTPAKAEGMRTGRPLEQVQTTFPFSCTAMATFPPLLPRDSPLGPNPYNAEAHSPWFSAYDRCLQLQASNPEWAMHARCLGYLLSEAIDDGSRHYIAREIVNCTGNDKLKDLAKFYIDHLFRLFRQNKGRTPAPSYHSSRDSFENERGFYSATVEPAPKDHSQAKKSALRRDGYRCMVTRDIDADYLDTLSPAERDILSQGGTGAAPTHLAHIFPPSTNRGLKPEEEGHSKTHYASTVWAIVNSFAHINVLDELNGDMAHRLSNALTLRADVHSLFDDLRMWFEEVPNTPQTYTVCSTHNMYLRSVPNPLVTFTSIGGLDLPDPRYLRLHAAICRVAHMSGAAEYLDLYDREQEERHVMAPDGTSGEFLNARLHRVLLTA
ncbi:hypothetical protein EI94DRAFT_1729918 [Lactarius quietus]|nr:hypothetical protein EI94DRAFT_1729918 [Lactarius quietus]